VSSIAQRRDQLGCWSESLTREKKKKKKKKKKKILAAEMSEFVLGELRKRRRKDPNAVCLVKSVETDRLH
jgi:hypothetical protein